MKKISFNQLKETLTRKEMKMIAGGGSTGYDVYEIRCSDGLLSRGLPSCSPSYYHICDGHGGVACCAVEDTVC
jgi:hypothetical protein